MFNYQASTASYDQIRIEGNPLNISTLVSNPVCAGDSLGSVIVTASGGAPQYNYLWNTGDTTNALSNLTPGSYTVMVTDSNGCMRSDSITITAAPPAITSSYTTTPVTCPGGSDGAVDLSASGGAGAFSYNWTTGDTTEDIYNAMAGVYIITVTDSLGCSHLDTAIISGPALWNVTVAASDPLCAGSTDGTLSATVSGATPGYSYSWSTGDTSASLSGLGAGTFVLTIMDSLGCTTTDISSLVEPLAIASSGVVADDTSSASTGAIDLTVSGGTAPFTFSWDNGATTEDLSGLSAGTYIVTVTDANGCTHMDTFMVSLFVGIGSAASAPSLEVYPNPAQEQINLVIANMPATETDIQLFDLRGKLLYEAHQAQSQSLRRQINLKDLSPGAYFLKVSGSDWVQHVRVLKQ